MFPKLIPFSVFCFTALAALDSCTHHHGAAKVEPDVSATCEEVRAAYDIGSGSTSVKVALVDTCNQTVKQVLYEDKEKVAYREDLSRSVDSKFSDEIMTTGLSVLRKFIEKSKTFQPKLNIAAATSAYRQASNAAVMVDRIKSELSLQVRIISPEEEGEIGFWSARSSTALSGKRIAVLDIGGGSTQLSLQGSALSDPPRVLHGPLASGTFKEKVMISVLKKDRLQSPNPLGLKNTKAAQDLVNNTLQTFSKEVLAMDIKGVEIVGIGNVFGFSILEQVKPAQNLLTISALRKVIQQRATWKDEKFDSKYAETDYTNLILVEAYMKALSVDTIRIVKANLTDGLLLGKIL